MEVLLGIEQDSCSPSRCRDWADYWIGSRPRALLTGPRESITASTGTGRSWSGACRDDCSAATAWPWSGAVLCRRGGHGGAEAHHPGPPGPDHQAQRETARFFDEESAAYRSAAAGGSPRRGPRRPPCWRSTPAAMARGYRTTPYPALFLLREWHEHGRAESSSPPTATAPTRWCSAMTRRQTLARAAGYQESWLLTRKGPVACPLEKTR